MSASAAETRARVVQATIDSILEDGFYKASSNQIARRAGVTWGVIQYHFGTREALLVAAFQEGMRDLVVTLQAATVSGDTFEARLESFADVIWSYYRQPKWVAYEQLMLNLAHDPETTPEARAAMTAMLDAIGRRLQELARSVVGDEAADVVPVTAIIHLVRGLAIGLALVEAGPGPRRRRTRAGEDPERRVLLDALGALLRERRPTGAGARRRSGSR